MKVFLDANILFSASLPGSRTGKLLALLMKRADVVTSAYAVEEARRNLARHSPAALDRLWRLVCGLHLTGGHAPRLEVDLPGKDRPILEAAVGAGCTHLLTGDFKHFGALLGQSVGGVRVLSMRMPVDEFVTKGWATEM